MVDIMAVNAVESMYHPGLHDPWAETVAVNFVDFFIYSDSIRYPIGRPAHIDVGDEHKLIPRLLWDLKRRDPDVVIDIPYTTEEFAELSQDAYEPVLKALDNYVVSRSAKAKVRDYVASRQAPWITRQPAARLVKHSVFDPQLLKASESFPGLARKLEVHEDELCYLLDLALRYPLYGELAGSGAYYLSHPIRTNIPLPTVVRSNGLAPNIPLPLGRAIMRVARTMTIDDFSAFLHEARGAVRSRGIHRMHRSQIEADLIREIASDLRLPARFKHGERLLTLTAGLLTILASNNAYATAGAVAGACAIATVFWKRPLPRALTRPWIEYAVTYDLERNMDSLSPAESDES